MAPQATLATALGVHRGASRRVVEAVGAMTPEIWEHPIAPGKWPPERIVAHLSAVYRVVLDELAGGPGMAVRTKPVRRFLLRRFLVPKLLRGGAFPRAAPAPRETRPEEPHRERAEALRTFGELAARFEVAAQNAPAKAHVTHAYFGAAPVPEGILLVSRHLEHHAAQLEAALLRGVEPAEDAGRQ